MPKQSTVIKAIKQKAARKQPLPKPKKKMGRPKTHLEPRTRISLQYPISLQPVFDTKPNRWDWILGAMEHQRLETGSAPVPVRPRPQRNEDGKRPMGRPPIRTEPYATMSFEYPTTSWDRFLRSVKPSRQAWIVWAMQEEVKREGQGQSQQQESER